MALDTPSTPQFVAVTGYATKDTVSNTDYVAVNVSFTYGANGQPSESELESIATSLRAALVGDGWDNVTLQFNYTSNAVVIPDPAP